MNLTKEQLNAPIQGAPNFTLAELIRSNAAISLKLDNTPTDETVIRYLQILAREALQKGRDVFGPMVVNSGYRSPAVNKAVGGSSTSWHSMGCAADIEVPGKSLWEVFAWYAKNVPCVELIAEELPHGWIHVAYSNTYNGPAVTKYKLRGQPVRKATFEEIEKIFKQQRLI